MKTAIRILGVIALFLVVLVLYIQFSYNVDFSEDYPVRVLEVEITPERVSHGEYLAYGPAHCASCHVRFEDIPDIDAGEKRPMIGGFEFTIPPAVLRAPNITPDPETGIGNLTDGELYRMLRYNVKHDGTTTIELMPFSTMSDEDIYSIIAYLRTQEPIKHEVAPTEWTLLGKALRTFAIKPMDDGLDTHPSMTKAPTVEYGEYLARSVANCRGCHTERDLKTGAFIGPEYAGGFLFEPSPETQGWAFMSPNLTPDETGVMSNWDQAAFFSRMTSGRTHMTSPMPWGTFSRLDSTDLTALWMFLSQLEPVSNEISQVAFPPEE